MSSALIWAHSQKFYFRETLFIKREPNVCAINGLLVFWTKMVNFCDSRESLFTWSNYQNSLVLYIDSSKVKIFNFQFRERAKIELKKEILCIGRKFKNPPKRPIVYWNRQKLKNWNSRLILGSCLNKRVNKYNNGNLWNIWLEDCFQQLNLRSACYLNG